jgi:hypothetical protein
MPAITETTNIIVLIFIVGVGVGVGDVGYGEIVLRICSVRLEFEDSVCPDIGSIRHG